jgi:hypothetical protein
LAGVEYQDDEIDTYKGVDMPDDGEPNCLKVWLNKVQLKDNDPAEIDIFNAIHDLVTETLESEIDLSKTDLTNTDFEFQDGDLTDFDEALEELGMEIAQ